jgi:hypothetical protein
MARNVTVNGTTYVIPDQGDNFSWGSGTGGTPGVTPLLQALSSSTLQPSGGTFALTNDVDFGSSHGTKSAFSTLHNNTGAPTSTANEVVIFSYNGELYISENGRDARPIRWPGTFTADRLTSGGQHLYGDGTTDDTPAIQAALNYAQDNFTVHNGKTIRVVLPKPTVAYRITSTLTYRGHPTCALRFCGELGATDGMAGTRILWDGSTGGVMMHVVGLDSCTFENLEFDGQYKAGKLLHIDYDEFNNGSRIEPSKNTRVTKCGFYRWQQNSSAYGIALGSTIVPNVQVSETWIQDCFFKGSELGVPYYGTGVGQLTAGNCKNVWVQNSQFYWMARGVYGQGSGSSILEVDGCYFGDVQTCVQASVTQARIVSCGAESAVADSQFVVGTTTSTPASVSIENCYAAITGPASNVIVSVTCPLHLVGNRLENMRTTTSIAKVETAAGRFESTDASANPRGGVFSHNNWFGNVSTSAPYAPIYDTSGNHLLADEWATTTGQVVFSFGDWGYDTQSVTNPFWLRPASGYPMEARLNSQSYQSVSPAVIEKAGSPRRVECVEYLDLTGLATGGASATAAIQIGKLYAKWKIIEVVMEVVTPLAGPGLTVATCSVGPTGTATGYLLAKDVMAVAGTAYGWQSDADFGALLSRANAVGGGRRESWTTSTLVKATVTLTGCNLNALTSGKIRFYVTYEATG